jgi:hypothetical protein
VLGVDVVMTELVRFAECQLQHSLGAPGEARAGEAEHARAEGGVGSSLDLGNVDADRGQGVLGLPAPGREYSGLFQQADRFLSRRSREVMAGAFDGG